MRPLGIASLILALVCQALSGLLALQIVDEIEEGFPVERRPSWRLLKPVHVPLEEVRIHAQKFPDRSLIRRWWAVLMFATYLLLLGGIVLLVARS